MNAPIIAPKISKAGLYELPMSVYHGDCCDGFSVSGSGLIKIEQECPAKFWHQSYLNPAREEQNDTPAMAFGRAVHMLLLEGPECFKAHYVIRPEGLNFSTKEGKAWRDAQTAEILTADDAIKIAQMVAAITEHPQARRAFMDGLSERSLIWRDPLTGIWLKARPDWLPNSLPFVPNYKTAASARPDDWVKTAADLGYHQSAALTVDAMKSVLDREVVPYFVVQEKEPPYVVTVCMLQDTDIQWGRLLNRRALDTLARCLETGVWPGYASEAVECRLPGWTQTQLQREHEAGLFQDAALNLSRLSAQPPVALAEAC